jgi:hypothetical protein
MTRTVILGVAGAALAIALVGIGVPTAAAQTATQRTGVAATQAYAQAPRRPRTRIRVTPHYYPYRLNSTDYPVPYPAEYPGPGYVRQCTSWLVTQNRVSGPVIMPRMRCWWQPGRSDLISVPP